MTDSRKETDLHLVITDSGLGGLLICAELERSLRSAVHQRKVRITYFNAWPQEGRGYNALPDMASRASVFDRALDRMAQFQPDRILIACNTLSIIYGVTQFSRSPAVPVLGIIDAGVDLFYDALISDPESPIVLIGTRTTIESAVHRDGLVRRGISPHRIIAVACPGLAAAIETNPSSPAVLRLIEECASQVSAAAFSCDALFCGFCCTHYTYVEHQIRSALERASGRKVRTLDPKDRLMRSLGAVAAELPDKIAGVPCLVEVISKVKLDQSARRAIAEQVERVSGATAEALLTYEHVPDLF